MIHSKMSKEEIEKNLKDIENHRVHVVINVAMLGEGYDHPYPRK
ncbi:MAG: repair protein RadD [Caldanaerobacter sp.]|nr:repair protein RadD [Caldanaerobacter sp.]